jgi:hypothetical protein
MGKNYLAAPPGDWIHPDDQAPPRAKKIRIYTNTGVEIHGTWSDSPLYLLWMPLTQVKPEMKDRLRREGKL